MDEHSRAMIKSIKTKVIAMIEERKSLVVGSTKLVSPSALWAEGMLNFDYMLGLDEESFSKLRLHTYHLTGDVWLTYLGDPQDFRVGGGLDTASKDIPSKLILNEPEGGIGFRYSDGRFISSDISRFQQVVNTLYRHGILTTLLSSEKQRSYLLEIGAGYGGLLHHLSNILGNVTCVIVDLPETMLFSASYLSLLNPNKKIYIYDSRDFPEFISSDSAKSYDFILVPNYRLDLLQDWSFDLGINLSSFQEMATEQVEVYLDFINKTFTGVFYSLNQERHEKNVELQNLTELLNARFELTEVFQPKIKGKMSFRRKLRRALFSIAIFTHLLETPSKIDPETRYREYICKPRGKINKGL